jgi:transposase
VKKYLAQGAPAVPPAGSWRQGTQPRKVGPFTAVVDSWLRADVLLRASVIWERLAAQYGYDGSYQRVKVYVAEARPRIAAELAAGDDSPLAGLHRRFEVVAGAQAQVDWGEENGVLVGVPKVYSFHMTLSYSRDPFCCYTAQTDMATFFGCHIRAFEYFGGVPASVVYDRTKTVVQRHVAPRAAVPLHPEAVAFAGHYGFEVDVLAAYRPMEKAACERAFGGIRSLLLELLLGYSGVDVADRGADPEGDAIWTLREMEHLLATWIVKIWQNRKLDQYAPAWDPGGQHSPNTLFAAAAARDGISLEIPGPSLYYELLPAHFVKIDGRRGVKVGGLWYGGSSPELAPYRGTLSSRSGRHRGKWMITRDPRDCREVFFEDPDDGCWHALRWNGLPPGDDVLAFSDARVREVLREAARSGLKPLDDRELLPVLLDLVAARTPVEAWPTQMSKAQRAERARELARARAAAADRPPGPRSPSQPVPPAVALPELARHNQRAVNDDRRRRREAAVPGRPKAPPLLGDVLRARSLFLLPDEDEDDQAGTGREPS